ncbi:MAG: class I SAM-dependent methyltransferase, partial [Candidatus Rifleibacteriota bacterium]
KMNCTLCNTELVEKVDEYYFICSTCGACVKDTRYYLSDELEKKRYEGHNNDVNDARYQKFTSPITNTVLDKFEPHHLGLDYGCGTGPVITKVLQDKGYNIKLYDPYFFPDEDYLNYRYDYIIACEVFEHLHHPAQDIAKLIKILKPGGHLLIMTFLYDSSIDFNKWGYRNDLTHVFIYSKKTINYIKDTFALKLERIDNRLIVFKKSG